VTNQKPPDETRQPALYSVDEVIALSGLGKTKLYEEMRVGRLRSLTVGSRRLIPRDWFEQWVEDLKATHATADDAA